MPPEKPTSSGEFSSKLSGKFAGDPRDFPLKAIGAQKSQSAGDKWHCLYSLSIMGGYITTAASLVIKILNIPPKGSTPSGEFLT